MKKATFKKLALTAETLRHLDAADMQDVVGGLQVTTRPVPTTPTKDGGCRTFTMTATVNPPLVPSPVSIAPMPGEG